MVEINNMSNDAPNQLAKSEMSSDVSVSWYVVGQSWIILCSHWLNLSCVIYETWVQSSQCWGHVQFDGLYVWVASFYYCVTQDVLWGSHWQRGFISEVKLLIAMLTLATYIIHMYLMLALAFCINISKRCWYYNNYTVTNHRFQHLILVPSK